MLAHETMMTTGGAAGTMHTVSSRTALLHAETGRRGRNRWESKGFSRSSANGCWGHFEAMAYENDSVTETTREDRAETVLFESSAFVRRLIQPSDNFQILCDALPRDGMEIQFARWSTDSSSDPASFTFSGQSTGLRSDAQMGTFFLRGSNGDVPALWSPRGLVVASLDQHGRLGAVGNSRVESWWEVSGSPTFHLSHHELEDVAVFWPMVVFSDDTEFDAWLAEYDASLTENDLVSDVDGHIDAWRAWAQRFYTQLTDVQVQNLANLEGNEEAFRRINKEAIGATHLDDRFDGRGRGLYVYRVRTIDAANNESVWSQSEAFPPVHIFDVTPPETPKIASVLAGEGSITITWRANHESDLKEYRVWRAESAEELSDVRRMPPHAVTAPTEDVTFEVLQDTELYGGIDYFYRVAAVDDACDHYA